MPNFGTLVLGPHEFRRFSAEIRFAENRRSRISLLRSTLASLIVLALHNRLTNRPLVSYSSCNRSSATWSAIPNVRPATMLA